MFLFGRTKTDHRPSTSMPSVDPNGRADLGRRQSSADHLQTLGLRPGASWDEIAEAHARLVADLTPGTGASHRNVALAQQLLAEVNQALASLRVQSVS